MCKHDKSLNNRGTNKLSVLTRKCFAKTSRAGGAPPRTDALIGPAAFRNVQKTDCLKRRASDAPSLFSSLLQLSGAPELVTARSNARKADLEAGPLDSHNEPTKEVQDRAKAVTPQNNELNNFRGEGSFPGDVTQPSQVSTREQPKEHEPNTWHPKQRTHAGNETSIEPALNPSKQVQTEFLILTELVKILIWMQ